MIYKQTEQRASACERQQSFSWYASHQGMRILVQLVRRFVRSDQFKFTSAVQILRELGFIPLARSKCCNLIWPVLAGSDWRLCLFWLPHKRMRLWIQPATRRLCPVFKSHIALPLASIRLSCRSTPAESEWLLSAYKAMHTEKERWAAGLAVCSKPSSCILKLGDDFLCQLVLKELVSCICKFNHSNVDSICLDFNRCFLMD